MADSPPQARLIRFEDFELDPHTGELRKAGVKLKFGGQPSQLLSILLERPGELVTRDQLQKQLWPDTFVDVDHNLNTAINKIREALGDSAETPRFVETIPGAATASSVRWKHRRHRPYRSNRSNPRPLFPSG
jgi:DNA-binding winged helix-turn-helix (wHTH) protein